MPKTIKIEDVRNTLKGAMDPEIGIDIIDLGLIYEIKIDGKNNITIKLTMTSPMCPVISIIMSDIQLRLESLPGVGKVKLDLVWEPAWNPGMMSEEYRAMAGV